MTLYLYLCQNRLQLGLELIRVRIDRLTVIRQDGSLHKCFNEGLKPSKRVWHTGELLCGIVCHRKLSRLLVFLFFVML